MKVHLKLIWLAQRPLINFVKSKYSHFHQLMKNKENGREGKNVNSGVTTVNVLIYNLPFYCLSRIAHMKCCPSFASAQLLDSSMILVKEEKNKT